MRTGIGPLDAPSAPADPSAKRASGPQAGRTLHWRRAGVTVASLAGIATLLWWKAIPCAFAAVTHVPCPGCGSTRAVLALASGDVSGLLRYNPFGPVMALLLLLLALKALSSVLLRGDFQGTTDGRSGAAISRAVLVLGILEFGLWVARFFGALGGPVPV